MSIRFVILWSLATLSIIGCGRKNGPGGGASASTNLSVVAWSPFLPAPNSYRHLQHLGQLNQKANALIATNNSIFGQSSAGKLGTDSPFRQLLGIPLDLPAYVTWWQTMDQRCIIIRSAKTEQWLGQIKINLKTGLVDSAHDVEALFVLSEIERRVREIVGTREEALRLFGGAARESPSPEQLRAGKALAEALFLPPDAKLLIDMSAPGGSNGGRGHLIVDAILPNGRTDWVASVGYPSVDNVLSVFGVGHPSYRFGGLALAPTWTNLNTQGFLLDSDGTPYPKTP